MPNLGSFLKEEIARLARRALRGEIDAVRKAVAHHRRDLAALKRKMALLERQQAALSRRAASARPAEAPATGRAKRFVAKGLRSQRTRLGLSADAFAKLAGVTAQTIYNWERGGAHPRAEQLARLVALRGIGKREAGRRLEALGANGKRRRRSAQVEQ